MSDRPQQSGPQSCSAMPAQGCYTPRAFKQCLASCLRVSRMLVAYNNLYDDVPVDVVSEKAYFKLASSYPNNEYILTCLRLPPTASTFFFAKYGDTHFVISLAGKITFEFLVV